MTKSRRVVRAATPDGQRAGEAVVEIIETQLRDNAPPETRRTLTRLMEMGQTRENAIRYIACALSLEIFEILKNKSVFNEKRYIENLKALPQLPDEPETEI